ISDPRIPRRLGGVIARALDPRPDRRFPTADALGGALDALEHSPARRRGAVSAVAAAIAVGVVTWGGGGLGGLPPLRRDRVDPAIIDPIIAVMPFRNLSSERDSDYFVDGLTSEVIRDLAVIDGLQVRSQTSSFSFKDKPRNLRLIGEQLRANLVVEADVLRVGNRLRINAQLVQIAGDVPLWSERFDRTLDDVFAIQDEISRAIVNKLRLTLGKGQRRYQTDLEPYQLYLRARTLVVLDGPSNVEAMRL